MGESSDAFVAEQMADTLDVLASKFRYAGNDDLAERFSRAADELRVGEGDD